MIQLGEPYKLLRVGGGYAWNCSKSKFGKLKDNASPGNDLLFAKFFKNSIFLIFVII